MRLGRKGNMLRVILLSIALMVAQGCGRSAGNGLAEGSDSGDRELLQEIQHELESVSEEVQQIKDAVVNTGNEAGEGAVETVGDEAGTGDAEAVTVEAGDAGTGTDEAGTAEAVTAAEDRDIPEEEGFYYDYQSVVNYISVYGHLPYNFITKNEARSLGWEGGSVEKYKKDAAIGGDHYGNYEGTLPRGNYTECDIDTHNYKNRGSRRLVFSDDGHFYYSSDHYESFTEVYPNL